MILRTIVSMFYILCINGCAIAMHQYPNYEFPDKASIKGHIVSILKYGFTEEAMVHIIEIDGIPTEPITFSTPEFHLKPGEHTLKVTGATNYSGVREFIMLSFNAGRKYQLVADSNDISFIFKLIDITDEQNKQVSEYLLVVANENHPFFTPEFEAKNNFEHYAYAAARAERRKDLAAAEEMCNRAAEFAISEKRGSRFESESLYNLGRIKSKIGKLDEAEKIISKSLEIEEKLTGPNSSNTGLRLGNLALVYFRKSEYDKGIPLIIRMGSLPDDYNDDTREAFVSMFEYYAHKARSLGLNEEAILLESKAASFRKKPGEN